MQSDREVIFSITRKRKPKYEWHSPRKEKLDRDYRYLVMLFYFLLVIAAASIPAGWHSGSSEISMAAIGLSFYFGALFVGFLIKRENNYLADRLDRIERRKV